jgi:hypothetical protein
MARQKEKIIGAYISKEENEKLTAKLKEDNLSNSEFIRACVKYYLDGLIEFKQPPLYFNKRG